MKALAVLLLAAMAGLLGACATPDADVQGPVTASDLTDADRRARARIELASAYYTRGLLETALDEVKKALQAKADLPAAYNLRGLIYSSMGDASLADASFQRAVQMRPPDADSMHNYGWFLCQQRRFDAAWVQFNAALALPQYGGAARTLAARGLCQARAGLWMEAEGSLMRSYELDPANPGTAMNLAEVLYRRTEFERARFYVGRVNAQVENTNAQSLWLAARIERKLGNAGQAAAYGEQLRARFPQAPEVALYAAGRFDE